METAGEALAIAQPTHGWEERVANEARRQAGIEAAFDRADAYERLGDFEPALHWLNRASALSGGLSSTYSAEHARFVRELERGKR